MRTYLTRIAAILLLGVWGALAQSAEDQYIRIYGLIQEGDRLVAENRAGEALVRYQEARGYLQSLQKGNPGWNDKIVKFRLNYLTQQIDTLSKKAPTPSEPAELEKPPGTVETPGGTGARGAAGISDLERQVSALRDQVKQLEGDRTALEAKLKEALAVQPAAIDPRELAKAESRIQSLQKENELLKVTFEQAKTRPPTAADTAALAAAKQALDEANSRLASQTARADRLEEEQKALQSKLGKITPSTWNAAEIEKTQKELARATNQVKEQREMITKMAAEREALQTRLKTVSADAAAAAAMREENELLKKQVAKIKAAGATKGGNGDLALQLTEARAQVAALQSEKQILQLEKVALENRVKQLAVASNGAPATPAVPLPYEPEEPSRIKKLEKEQRNLEQQLAAARKELASRRAKSTPSQVQELEKQVKSLQARLQVYESAPVPYTSAELALYNPPSPATNATAQSRPSSKAPPAGTSEMVADARRFSAAREFDKAEETYQAILKKDQDNVYTLSHLAFTQVESGKLAEAEKNVLRAEKLAPDDPGTLSVLGQLRYKQGKYDEAFEAFSRAAQLDAKNADIQNFLGVTLTQKGMRLAAQTAFRKAIQLNPEYADAHQNLAISYLSQTPPLVELARYHYDKAVAAGWPRSEAFEKELESKKAK